MQFTSGESEPVEVTEDDALREALQHYRRAELEFVEAEAAHKLAKEHLLKALKRLGVQSTYVELNGQVFKTTAVEGETVKIDSDGLQKAIGKRAWNALTKRVIDRSLVEKAVASGQLDPWVAAEFIEVKPKAAYPKITPLEGATEQ